MPRQDVVHRCYEEACTLTLTGGLCRVSALASVLMKYGCSVEEVSVMLRSLYRSDIPADEVVDCCNGIVSTPWSISVKECVSPYYTEVLETVMSTFRYFPEDISLLYGRGLEPVDVPDSFTAVTLRGWEFMRTVIDGETVIGISEYLEGLPASRISQIVSVMLCIPSGAGFHEALMRHPRFRQTLEWTTTYEYLRASTGCGGRMMYDPRGRPMPSYFNDIKGMSVTFDGILFGWVENDILFTVVPAADLVLLGKVLDDPRLSKRSFFALSKILAHYLICQKNRVPIRFRVSEAEAMQAELEGLGMVDSPWIVSGDMVEVHPDPIVAPVRGAPEFRDVL